jgi:hypothetical protein
MLLCYEVCHASFTEQRSEGRLASWARKKLWSRVLAHFPLDASAESARRQRYLFGTLLCLLLLEAAMYGFRVSIAVAVASDAADQLPLPALLITVDTFALLARIGLLGALLLLSAHRTAATAHLLHFWRLRGYTAQGGRPGRASSRESPGVDEQEDDANALPEHLRREKHVDAFHKVRSRAEQEQSRAEQSICYATLSRCGAAARCR